MKKIILNIVLAVLCLNFTTKAKDKTSITALKIGDTVPEITIGNIINYKDKNGKLATTAKFSDFKGKLLILDFWATSCGSCIAALPKLNSLQTEFKGSIQILPVSFEKKAIPQRFLKVNPIGKSLRLPVVSDDVILASLFPHRIISHEVWINDRGIVVAITDPEYVNADNISRFLHHEIFNLPVKTDVYGYDYSKLLLNQGSDAIFYSMIGAYRTGISQKNGYLQDSISHKTRLYIINSTILQMYLFALTKPVNLPRSMMQILVKDSTRLFIPSNVYNDEWNKKHSWCYEAILPYGTPKDKMKAGLLLDLDKFFHLKGMMEKKNVRCWAINYSGVNQDDSVFLRGGSLPVNSVQRNDPKKIVGNISLSDLIWELNNTSNALPTINNTGFNGIINLNLPVASLKDLSKLNDALRPYSLTINEVVQPVELFVLTDFN